MLIEKLIIENFKVFRDIVEIDLSKHPVYAFVGKNASGKSSILDAVNKAVYRNDVRQEAWDKSRPARVEIIPHVAGLRCYKIRSTKGVFEPLPKGQREEEPDFVRLLMYYPSQTVRDVCDKASSVLKRNISVISKNPFNIEVGGVVLKPYQLSAGTQAILTMEAILNYPAIGSQDKVIFLIEEPEAFLHPNLLRDYMTRLIEFFTENSDRYKLLISTHSPVVLSMLEPSQVIRVADGKVYPCFVDFKGWYMMTDQNKAELFFADRVILLEGFTDKVVYSFLLQGMGVRPEKYNVSIIHTDGAYNKDKIIEICENYGIKTLYVADKDQENDFSYKPIQKAKSLSYGIILEYGELEDAPTLIDFAMALGEEFIKFIYYKCVLMSGDKNSEEYRRAEKYFRKRKVDHALKLGQLYAQKPITKTHPLYPLFLSLKDFIEQGVFTKPEFIQKPSLEEEIKQYCFVFIEEGIYSELSQEKICNAQQNIVGTIFTSRNYGNLNRCIKKLADMGIPFRMAVGESYDINVLGITFKDYKPSIGGNYAIIDKSIVFKIDNSISEDKKHNLFSILISDKPLNPDLLQRAL